MRGRASTTGDDIDPDGYKVYVDGSKTGSVAANDELLLHRADGRRAYVQAP